MKKTIIKYLPLGICILFFIWISKIYLDRVGTYSFGDEYTNIVAGYFLTKGRSLYSQIFYNHMPLIAYISFFIQAITHPAILYKYILYHRLFVIVWSFGWSLFLVKKYRYAILIPILLFEFYKYYLFGNLFLAESLIVYPCMYLFLLVLHGLHKQYPNKFEIIFASIVFWFIFWMREPYVPFITVLFILLAIQIQTRKRRIAIIGIATTLSLLTFILLPIKDFIYQVVSFNIRYMIPLESAGTGIMGIGIFKSFFYPVYILLTGQMNFFHLILIGVDIIFIFCVICMLYYKNIKDVILIFFLLGLANLRIIEPGKIFFEAFHMIVWYGIFLSSIGYMLSRFTHKNLLLSKIGYGGLLMCLIYTLSWSSFIWMHIDKQREFTINYAHHYITGQVIHDLSRPNQTVFADQWDYLWYVVANREVSYPYAIYSFATKSDPFFRTARDSMFLTQPPDFYYTYCGEKQIESPLLSQKILTNYTQLQYKGKPTCLYIKTAIIPGISQAQWQQAQDLGFSLLSQTW